MPFVGRLGNLPVFSDPQVAGIRADTQEDVSAEGALARSTRMTLLRWARVEHNCVTEAGSFHAASV
jgi:hypothetical protein